MPISLPGWRAHADEDAALGYHASGDALVFDCGINRPKSYFAVLASIESILSKMEQCEDAVPVVYHGMTDSYYRALMSLSSRSDMLKLQGILDVTANVLTIKDNEFAVLLHGTGDEGDEPPVSEDLPALLDMPRPSDEDMRSLHRNAVAVLRGLPHHLVDMRTSYSAERDGHRIIVHFDNCSHSSGKQRCYVSCTHRLHQACFKYSIVDRFRSPQEAAAWLVLWAAHARHQPDSFTKDDHKRFAPADADVQALVPLMVEDAPAGAAA